MVVLFCFDADKCLPAHMLSLPLYSRREGQLARFTFVLFSFEIRQPDDEAPSIAQVVLFVINITVQAVIISTIVDIPNTLTLASPARSRAATPVSSSVTQVHNGVV
jgi:hypothetical protein